MTKISGPTYSESMHDNPEKWNFSTNVFLVITIISFIVLSLLGCSHCKTTANKKYICSHCTIIIYPWTTRVVGAPQMILQPVSFIFLCSQLPSGTCWTPGLSIPWCCLPTSSSVCLSSSPFHCALQDGFSQTWWAGDMTIPLQFASLYDRLEVFMWSSCLLDLGTDFLVGNMVFVWDV